MSRDRAAWRCLRLLFASHCPGVPTVLEMRLASASAKNVRITIHLARKAAALRRIQLRRAQMRSHRRSLARLPSRMPTLSRTQSRSLLKHSMRQRRSRRW